VSRTHRSGRPFALAAALSVALHGVAWGSISRPRPAPARERIEMEIVRRERATAPQPAKAPPAPRRVAVAAPVPVGPPREPPPALASAPAPAPGPAPRAIPKVGISLGSTVAGGGFAVGVGNTAYGRAEETAADPASVRPYSGGVVPPTRLSAQPRVVELPEIPYPADARRAGVEGRVVLLLRIDARGAVTAVRVVEAPAPSLAAAALDGARRFRFTPGLAEGEPVETEIRFTYTFLLE
jgi:protein TonB